MATDFVERDAKLFEAGSYPDKELEITEEDLDRIISGTSEVPVKIEHVDSPLDGALGVLKSLYRKGKELFGKICFPRRAWDLIKDANARRLSIALKRDKSAIAEVSLVREPRVADAAVFSAGDAIQMDGGQLCPNPEFSGEPEDNEVRKLRHELAEKNAQSKIDELKRAGKITPASEAFAKAILTSADSQAVLFSDGPKPLREVFLAFLNSQPRVIEFSELAAANSLSEEPEIFTKLGITSRQADKYR